MRRSSVSEASDRTNGTRSTAGTFDRLQQDEDASIEELEGRGAPLASVSPWQCCCRVIVLLLLLSAVAVVITDFATTKYIASFSVTFVQWVGRHPPEGVLAVIVIFAFATVLFMPANVMTIGAGFAFHTAFDTYNKAVALGSIAVFFGSLFGSMASFLLGRYLLRAPVLNMAAKYPIFRAIDNAMGGSGLKIMFLLRLSPLIPYNALDYLSGVTSIPLWQYSLACLGMLPGMIMFCAIGAAASSLADGEKWVEENRMIRVTAILGGLVFTIGGVAVASYYSKIELEKILEEQRRKTRGVVVVSDLEAGSTSEAGADEESSRHSP